MSEEGEILDHSRQIFSKEIIEEKKSLDQKNKFKKNIMETNKRQFENSLKNESSVVPKCFHLQKNHRISQLTASTHSSDSTAQSPIMVPISTNQFFTARNRTFIHVTASNTNIYTTFPLG